MAVLSIENEEKAGSGIVNVQFAIPSGFTDNQLKDFLTNTQINNVMKDGQAYHFENKLILKFTPTAEESFQTIFHEDMSIPLAWGFDVYFRDRTTSSSGFERDTFGVVTYARPNNVTLTNNGSTAEIVFSDELDTIVEDLFTRRGKNRPDEGFMFFKFESELLGQSGGARNFYFLIKVSFRPLIDFAFAPSAPKEAFVESDYGTKPLAYEVLHVPKLSASFTYNFFEIDEDSLLAARRKNYNLRDLSSVPRYIRLKWSPAPVVTNPFFRFTTEITASTDAPESTGRKQSPEAARRLRETRDKALALLKSGFSKDGILGGAGLAASSSSDFFTVPTTQDAEQYDGGSRKQPEDDSQTVSFGGQIWSVPSEEEEESNIWTSKTKTGEMAKDGEPRFNSPPSRPDFVGEDSTISLGLPAEEELILRNIVKNTDQPDTIAGPNEFSRYIGYVVLKERFNPDTAQFEPIDMIGILDRRKTEIVDTKIAYGDTYRYKVRSVFKFVNVDELPLFRDQDTSFEGETSGTLRSVFDGGTPFRNAFYFDSKFSRPAEIYVFENNRPDPPENVHLFPNSKKREIFVSWNQKQQERDVVGYNVYKKPDVTGSLFRKITDIPLALRHNYFIDKDVDFDTPYIYAIESVDQHDNFSKLSIQKKVALKIQDFSVGRVENPVKIHLNEEVELGELGTPKRKGEVINFLNSFKITINPLYTNIDRSDNYLFKIKSLDSFMEKEIKLNFSTKVINHSGAVVVPDDIFEERRDQIETATNEAERIRLGLTEEEYRRRLRNKNRGSFEE